MSDQRCRTSHLTWVVIGLVVLSTSAFLKQVVQTAPDRSVGRHAEPGRLVRPSRSAGIGGERASAAKLTALRPGDWRSPTAAPRDVAAPPPDATKTESGLAYGDKHPTAPGMLVFDVELLEIK